MLQDLPLLRMHQQERPHQRLRKKNDVMHTKYNTQSSQHYAQSSYRISPYSNHKMAMNSSLWKSQSVQQQIQRKLLFSKKWFVKKFWSYFCMCWWCRGMAGVCLPSYVDMAQEWLLHNLTAQLMSHWTACTCGTVHWIAYNINYKKNVHVTYLNQNPMTLLLVSSFRTIWRPQICLVNLFLMASEILTIR